MAQPAISVSSPSDGDTDVFINIPLEVTFTAALLASSVSDTTVILEEVGSGKVIKSDVSLPTSTEVRISPIGALAENTLYKIKFPGTDIAISSDYVIKDNATSDALISTLTIQFRTGTRAYIDDTNIDKNATDLSLEGDLNLPIHVKALGDLAISSTVPRNNSYDQVSISSIDIVFNNSLSTGDFVETWIEVDAYPLLDSTEWLAISGAFSGASIPDYTVSLLDDTITVTFDSELPQNVGVSLTASKDIVATDGSEFGPNDYYLTFTTERYPSYSGIHEVKRELKAISEELTDDYITATLFSNTAEYLCKYDGRTVENCLIQKWVLNKTIVDILDDKELEKAVVAGTRRQLGDMSVSVDPIIGKMSLKHQRALKELDRVQKTILKPTAKSYSLEGQTGILRTYRRWPGVNGRIVQSRFVYWQPDIPASNLSVNRAAKNPNWNFF